jgi:hypothetical protein
MDTTAHAAVGLGGSAAIRTPCLPTLPITVHDVFLPLRPTYLAMIAIRVTINALVDWVIRHTTIGHAFRQKRNS